MTKLIAIFALLASACSATTVDGPIYAPSGDRGPSATADGAPVERAFSAAREPVAREAFRARAARADGEPFVCAQCR